MKTSRLALGANLGGALHARDSVALAASEGLLRIRTGIVRAAQAWMALAAALWTVATPPAAASAVGLAWNANPQADITGYRLSYGTTSGVFPNVVTTGATPEATVTGLNAGTTYFFVVAAVNHAGLQSDISAVLSYQVPAAEVNPPAGWTLKLVDSEEAQGYPATAAFDGNPLTFWHTAWSTGPTPPPHEIQIDLGSLQTLAGFRYLPRQDNYAVGNISQYEFYVSPNGTTWGSPVASGTFANNSSLKEIPFAAKSGRFIRLRSLSAANGGTECAVAEISVIQTTEVPVNQVPVALANTLTTVEDTPLALTLAGTDADSDALTFSIASGPAHGTLTGTPPNLTYTPSPGYYVGDGFTFRVNDGTVDSATATITLAVTQKPMTGPTLLAKTGWSLKYVDSQETFDSPATSAFDGNPNTFWHTQWRTGTTPPPPHEIQINLGAVRAVSGFQYLPRQDPYVAGSVRNYEFYVSSDGVNWGSPVATGAFANTKAQKQVLFTTKSGQFIRFRALSEINGANDTCVAELNVLQGNLTNQPPLATPQTLETDEDTPLPVVLGGNDPDGASLTYTISTAPAHGTLSGTAPNLTYLPHADYTGSDQFTFRSNDGAVFSAVATIAIQVTPVAPVPGNTAPVFIGMLIAAAAEDEPFSGQLNATDVNAGDTLTYRKISGPAWLTVSPSGALGGTPLNPHVGLNSFSLKVSDPSNASATAILHVTVANSNDAPAFRLDPLAYPAGTEKIQYRGQSLASTATDPDAGDALSYSKVSGPDWLTVARSGLLGGTPPAGSSGENEFTVRATDPSGASATAVLLIRINPNSLPLPWNLDRVGKDNVAGAARYSAGTFTVAGAGALAEKSDAGNFGWQTLTGDGEITARVTHLDDTGAATRVGVMIRESLAPNARHAFLGVDGDGDYQFLRRAQTGGKTSKTSKSPGKGRATWLRLVRKDDTLSAFKSTDGEKWTEIGDARVNLPKHCYIGLSVSSGKKDELNTSKFSNVRVTR